MLAPTSSTAVTPRRVGQLATAAGRSSPPAMRSSSLEMAISAPVLPPETAAAASPRFTDSTQFQRLEPLPRRSARAGFSSLVMRWSVWRTSLSARTAARLGQFRRDGGLVAMQQETHLASRQPLQGEFGAGHGYGRAMIPAHRIDRDHKRSGHGSTKIPVRANRPKRPGR